MHFDNLFEKDMTYDIPTMVSEATGVLKSLIEPPSLSRDKVKARFFRWDPSCVEERRPIVQCEYEITVRGDDSRLIFINNPI